MTELDVAALCRRLPKVDLHLHLDGSLSEEFLAARAEKYGPPLPAPVSELRSYLLDTKDVAPNQPKGGNWPAFDICNQYLQTADALRAATLDLLARVHGQHNVRVCEIRFCPALHTADALTADDAVGAVASAYAEYAVRHRATLRGGVLICALRSMGPEHVADTVALAADCRSKYPFVLGADLAGDEGAFPLTEELSEALASAEVPLTVHAGEWTTGDAAAAVDVGACRIGHGLSIVRDVALMARMRELGVAVEVCLTSNCAVPHKTGVLAYASHPVRQMLESGVTVVGFNCDNTMLSGTKEDRADPSSEVQKAIERVGLSWSQVRRVLIDGAHASFGITNKDDDKSFLKRFQNDVDNELRNAGVLNIE